MYNNQENVESPTRIARSLWFDKGYWKTLPGILKIVELACNLIGFIVIKVSSAIISPLFFNILYWVCIVITGFLLLFYTIHFVEKYPRIPWSKFEFVYCGVVTLCYIGTSIFATVIGEGGGIAIGVFGFAAIVAYAMDCYLKFKQLRGSQPAQ